MPIPTERDSSDSSVNQPTVAIIIPCYNHGEYIEQAIASVAEQDYPNKCLSIVDDASTDDSAARIKGLFTHIEKEFLAGAGVTVTIGKIDELTAAFAKLETNHKRPGARNVAIKMAWQTADCFCPLDADDKFLPGKLSKSIEVMLRDQKNIGLVYSDDIIYNINTKISVHQFRPPFDRRHLEAENYICNCPLFRKEAIGFVGMYDESLELCEDWDMWLRITEYYSAVHIPEPLSQYTETGNNCTLTVSNDEWNKYRLLLYAKMMERRKKNYG